MFLRRYIARFDTSKLPHSRAEVLVLGSGIAGLRAAIEAAEAGRSVIVATKAHASESNTFYAQGGVAAAFAPDDTVEGHVADTISAGAGLCGEQVVRLVVEEGKDRVRELLAWGTEFDRSEDGELAWTREGGHTHARILHASGDATGREVERALLERARAHPRVEIRENVFAIDLITADGRCVGALVDASGARHVLLARATVLATGGCGRVFRESTNPPVATGDGIAMAARAGARLLDMEFVQFHPTVLYVAGAARALVSEAVRGEGALLVDADGVRFMPEVHEMAELAPRDIVSRAIVARINETGHPCCYLDLGHLDPAEVRARFPGIAQLCRGFGLDLARDRIPVRPAAHYMIGGVKTDLHGATTVPGLWAAGEASCTTLHGANRLGSNSLLEGLVFGTRAGAAAAAEAAGQGPPDSSISSTIRPDPSLGGLSYPPIDVADAAASLRSLMWQRAGVERSAEGLSFAQKQMEFWSRYILEAEFDAPSGWELQNMLLIAALIVRQALRREESRGVHYRTDFPRSREQLASHAEVSVAELAAGDTPSASARLRGLAASDVSGPQS